MITREQLIVGNRYSTDGNSITLLCIGKHKIFYSYDSGAGENAWHISDALKNLSVTKKTKKIQMVEIFVNDNEIRHIRHVERDYVDNCYMKSSYTIIREYEIEIPE